MQPRGFRAARKYKAGVGALTFALRMEESLPLSRFSYELPAERIALHPPANRQDARLLCHIGGEITHRHFKDITDLLPPGAMLVLNDTRVVHARLYMQRPTGAGVELLLLRPLEPYAEINLAMADESGKALWTCMAGNSRRWKEGEILQPQTEGALPLQAKLLEKNGKEVKVEFQWPQGTPWSRLLEEAGKLPLPPYMRREAEEADEQQYQTVYARHPGAVAAPTAGLHFTESLLDACTNKGIDILRLTLHVGAGTFAPVSAEGDVRQHDMHREQIVFSAECIARLAAHAGPIVAVGTTSLRALESLWQMANRVHSGKVLPPEGTPFFIPKESGFMHSRSGPEDKEVLQSLQAAMEAEGRKELLGETEIMIIPGYQFGLTDMLITNFHQPGSTLLMLIAAFAGEPEWRKIYEAALAGDYRFLSYGDAMITERS